MIKKIKTVQPIGALVRQVYPDINEDTLEEISHGGKVDEEYIASCIDFVRKISDRPLDRLSDKQKDWIEKINDMCSKYG